MERLYRVASRVIGPRTVLFNQLPCKPALLLMRECEEGRAAVPDLPTEDYRNLLRALGFRDYEVEKRGIHLKIRAGRSLFVGHLRKPPKKHPYYLGEVKIVG